MLEEARGIKGRGDGSILYEKLRVCVEMVFWVAMGWMSFGAVTL